MRDLLASQPCLPHRSHRSSAHERVIRRVASQLDDLTSSRSFRFDLVLLGFELQRLSLGPGGLAELPAQPGPSACPFSHRPRPLRYTSASLPACLGGHEQRTTSPKHGTDDHANPQHTGGSGIRNILVRTPTGPARRRTHALSFIGSSHQRKISSMRVVRYLLA